MIIYSDHIAAVHTTVQQISPPEEPNDLDLRIGFIALQQKLVQVG